MNRPLSLSAPAAPLSLRELLRSMQLAVPLSTLAVLMLVAQFDARLSAFLGHSVAAVGCFLVMSVVSSSYARGGDGYLRYVGYAIPWVALFELSVAFRAAHDGLADQGEALHRAVFLMHAGLIAVAPLWIGRKVRLASAVVPWGGVAALLFAAVLAAPPAGGHWVAELGIAALALIGIAGLVRQRARLDPRMHGLLFASAVSTLAAFGVSVLDEHRAGGVDLSHAARLLGLWLLYVAAARASIAVLSREQLPYRELFQSSIVGVSLTRADGSYVAVNPAYAALFGYPSAEQLLAEMPNSRLFAQPGRDLEVRIRRRDGETRWITGNVVEVKNRDGGVIGYQASVYDITEARAAREQARLESRRLQQLIELLPVGVWMLDLSGHVVLRNEAARRLWGGSVPGGIERFERYQGWWGRTGRRIGANEWPIRRTLSHGEPRSGEEIEILNFAGERRILRNSTALVRDEDGRAIGALAVNEDITELKRREAELARAAAIVQSSKDAIFDEDRNGTILSWNDGARGMYGYEPREIVGRPVHTLIPPELRAAETAVFRSVLEGERVADYETTGLRKDGSRVRVSLSVSPIRDAAGRVTGIAKIARDVSARERAAAAVRESHERFQMVSRATNDAVWDWDLTANSVWWNAGYETLFGHRLAQLPAALASWYEHLHPADLERVRRSIEAAIASDAQTWSDEYRFRRADGSYADIFDRGFLVRDAAGRALRMIGAMMDITARKRAEHERGKLARMYAALSSVNELVARAASRDALLQEACEIAVASGDYQFALVRMVDPASHLAAVAAFAGARDMRPWFERPIDVREHSPDGHLLAALAFRSGRPVRVDEADVAQRFPMVGARAAGAYPLRLGGACVGALLLRSPDPLGFEGEMGDLLERMAASISLGLERLQAADEQRRFRLAMDHSGDMMVLVDRETMRFVDVNETLCRVVGYSRAELLSMRVDELVEGPGDELERAYDALIADPSATAAYRGAYRCKDGSRVPFESTRRMIRARERWLMVGISRDLRERLAADEALRRREQEFRTLVQNLPDIVARWTPELRCAYVSEPVGGPTGRSPEWFAGKTLREMALPEGFVAAWEAELRQAFSRGEPSALEFAFPAADGVRHYEARFLPEKAADGRVTMVMSLARDITARVRSAERLRRQDAYFRALVENVSDAIAVTDLDWRYLYISPSCTVLTGYRPEELLGKCFGETSGTGDGAALRARLAAQLGRSERPQQVRFELRRKDGEARIHETLVSKGTAPDGQPIYVIAGRDVTDRVRAEQALGKREEELRTLADNSPDGILRFDAQLRCTFVNRAVEKATGRPAASMVGRTLLAQQVPQPLHEVWHAAIQRTFATGEVQTVDYGFEGPRGPREYQARFAPERSAAGVVESVMVISRDITDRKRAERAVAESEARLRSIVEATAEPLLLVDPEGAVLFSNPAAAALFGRGAAELAGKPLGLPLADGRPADVAIVLPDGAVRAAEMQFAATRIEGRQVLVVSLHDLSERKRYEAHIEHLANHDALTGLPNRTLLRDRVEQAIAHARRTHGYVALLFVDLDHFKLINDSFGHATGDGLLLEVGRRLKAAVRDGDTVARLGGDEFVILAPDLAQPGDAAVVARKVAEALGPIASFDGRQLQVSSSIGISLFPGDGDDLDLLLQCADAAMYRAKDAGRANYQFYSAEMGVQARARVDTETGLRRALERDELRLYYQPQVDLASGHVVGFEALLRWQNPERGLVSPAAFVPVAEESGLIVPMGQWALRTACRDAAAWAAAGLGSLKIAVNLSARQFWQGTVIEAVRQALAESGLPAAQLEVEITESVVARDLQQVVNTLMQLRRMGVSVAIDDFGTGYSSLAYLRSLPIQQLKIDKSFIDGIPLDAEAAALVSEIIRLAHVLSLQVVAEGVETHAQAAYLRDAGCEGMQGFLFARPMPADDCAVLLRSRRRLQLGNDGR